MSLVAYGASDDSETSDVEDAGIAQTITSADNNDRGDGKISDEEDYVPTASGSSSQIASSSTNDARLWAPVSVPSNLGGTYFLFCSTS